MLRTPSKNWDLVGEIVTLKEKALYRRMPEVSGIPGRIINIDGRSVLNFSSNNYLGLAGHPQILEAFSKAVHTYGAGSTASRLIAGNTHSHRQLEEFIANWKKTEAALVFGSGYQANLGILTTLTNKEDLVISDELNHASIIDGCRLSRAKISVYRHLDLNSASDALKQPGFRRKLLITESIFSMDGDHAPLKELSNLCREHDAFMVVDEAHATGIYGPSGQGLCSELGAIPDVQMGTLGKAAGVSGAYVAGSRSLIDLLVNKARSFIFTTAHSPAVSEAALEALKIIVSPEGDRRRSMLIGNARRMDEMLRRVLPRREFACHIKPIHVGPSDLTMRMSEACLDQGLFVHGIRFPSVREGASRLRLTVMSDHTTEDLRKASRIIETLFTARVNC
jgi:8-amino-7-oxononanoate synthase